MSIADNIIETQKTISAATQNAGRDPESVRLIAVSKKQPETRIRAALEAGQRVFGENRVQEAQDHWVMLRSDYPGLELHLIGPLQTNKAADAVALFDVIQTLDRPKLVHALAREMEKQDRNLPCFIQVNTGGEDQKAGVSPEELPSLLALARAEGLTVTGLMCIPPVEEPPALHFAFLKKLADENGLTELSMGMSGDFEKAVPLGATYVRVGTALFGNRA
ncbi:MAG: YggS family pyridoxal phosphate-dependent enzyme [Alphaproteobacteria bacterium]